MLSVPTTTTTAAPQQINVADLDLPQLAEVKRQLEEVGAFSSPSSGHPTHSNSPCQELSHLTNSFAQLKQAQAKFRSCIESAKEVKPENKGTVIHIRVPLLGHLPDKDCRGKAILVPLTSSLYVPGRLLDVENVLIDIGTGYYIQKVRLHFLLR